MIVFPVVEQISSELVGMVYLDIVKKINEVNNTRWYIVQNIAKVMDSIHLFWSGWEGINRSTLERNFENRF